MPPTRTIHPSIQSGIISQRTSIIIPCLNEESAIAETLKRLCCIRGEKEIIVADGGSTDRTVEIATSFGAMVVTGARGRGSQQRLAAEHANGDVLWFLHADTLPDADALELIEIAFSDPEVAAGNFRLRFTGKSFGARFTTAYQPLLRLAGLIYGDSAIFIRKAAYLAAGGFRELPLFEDLDLVKRIKRFGRFVTVTGSVTTSSRRFEGRSYPRTFLLWTCLQLAYSLGVSPSHLAEFYRDYR
jgi:rSAM/selenodomain-associated transferase 2